MYINKKQIYKSNGLSAPKSYISNIFNWVTSECKEVFEGYDYEEVTDEITEAPLFEPFFTKRMKMLSIPDGFLLYGKQRVDFFSISELLYPNVEFRLRLIRAGPIFDKISGNPNVSLGIGVVDSSLYTRRIALKDDYHKKIVERLAYNPVEWSSTFWRL